MLEIRATSSGVPYVPGPRRLAAVDGAVAVADPTDVAQLGRSSEAAAPARGNLLQQAARTALKVAQGLWAASPLFIPLSFKAVGDMVGRPLSGQSGPRRSALGWLNANAPRKLESAIGRMVGMASEIGHSRLLRQARRFGSTANLLGLPRTPTRTPSGHRC